MKTPLKYPNGDFTWGELAAFNGTNKPGVWVRFDEAKRNKTIIQVGERPQPAGCRGKPEKLWRLANPQTKPIVSSPVVVTPPATPPAPVAVIMTPAVVVPTEAIIVSANEPKLLPESTETKIETPVVVEVLKVEPNGVVTPPAEIDCRPPLPVVEVQKIVEDAQTLTETCPVCGHPLVAAKDATGVMVWCHQPSEICPSSENPFGHGKDEKEAYLVLVDKFSRRSSIVSIGSSRIKD